MAASVLGALGAPVFLASSGGAAVAADAAAARPAPRPAANSAAADIRFTYESPRVSPDGDHLTWRWTLRNTGPGAAGDVVLVHRLTPPLKISRLPRECRAIAHGASCSYGTIKAGQRRTGSLDAELSRDVSGTVEIHGRVTWQQVTSGPAGSDSDVAPVNPPAAGMAPGQPGRSSYAPGQTGHLAPIPAAAAAAKRPGRVPR